MPEFRFTLDSTVVQDPEGWQDMTIDIVLDTSIGIPLRYLKYGATLKFRGDGYEYLRNEFDTGSQCGLITVTVDHKCTTTNNWKKLVQATIRMSEVTLNRERCTATTKLFDDNFDTRISNNKSIKTFLNGTETKNGSAITPVSETAIQFFTPSDGNYTDDVYCYKVHDALKYMVAFASDNAVTFRSDYFDTGDGEPYYLASGLSISSRQSGYAPRVSFKQLVEDLHRKFNLGLAFTQVGGTPQVRIEEADFFYNASSAFTLTNVMDIEERVDVARIFSHMRFGDSKYLEQWQGDDDQSLEVPQMQFRSFKDEVFGIRGECNIDRELNTVNEQLIVDPNVIQNVFEYRNGDHANDTFLIQTDMPGTAQANQSDPYTLSQNWYNEGLRNNQVSLRWLNGVPNSIFNSLNNTNTNDFYVDLTASTAAVLVPYIAGGSADLGTNQVVVFDNDSVAPAFNTNGRYDNTTGRWHVENPGNYTFQINIACTSNTGAGGRTHEIRTHLRRYSANDTLITQSSVLNLQVTTYTAVNLPVFNPSLFANSQDYFTVEVQIRDITGPTQSGDFVIVPTVAPNSATNWSQTAASLVQDDGVIETYDPNDYKGILYKFERGLSETDRSALLANTNLSILFNSGTLPQTQRRGWSKKVSINPATGNTSFELTANP